MSNGNIRALVQAMQSTTRDEGGPPQQKRVTSRIPILDYWKLQEVASECGMTPTGLAESILAYAIDEAWDAAGFGNDQFDAMLRKHGYDVAKPGQPWKEDVPSVVSATELPPDVFLREEASN